MNATGLHNKTDHTNTALIGSLVVNNNNIVGNGFGLQNDETTTVNAQQDWWGAADGPGPVGPGSGDKVSSNVDFSNFLTSAATCASKVDQQITFGALANKTFGDADFTVSATASSGLPVSFTASGQCTVSGNLVHLTGAGSCTITASQDGNSNYNPAPDVMQSFTVAKASTATAVSSSANPSTSGQNVTFTATVTSSAGVPTGTVQFVIDGSNFGGPVTLSNGTAQTSTSSLTAAGSPHSVSATYSGDSNFLGSSGSLAGGQTVSAPTPTPYANTYAYANTYTYTYTYAGTYSYSHSHSYANTYSHAGTYSYSHSYIHANTYSHAGTYSYSHPCTYTYANTYSHAGTYSYSPPLHLHLHLHLRQHLRQHLLPRRHLQLLPPLHLPLRQHRPRRSTSRPGCG